MSFGPNVVLRFLAAAGAVAMVAGGAAAAPFCRDPAVDAEVGQLARNALPADRLAALETRLNDAAGLGCGPQVAYCVGQRAALAAVDRAYALLGAGTPDLAGARETLIQGRKHGAPWQLLVALGDVEAAAARQDSDPALFGDAAADLQLALNAINDPPLCTAFGEVRPGADDIRRIRKRAEEAVLLAPRFALTRTRSGECGGIMLGTVRGIDVETTPVPITFAFGKAEMTPEGQKAADALLQCLKEKALPAITLTGHTDAHGSDGYNMQLSAARLDAVQTFLKSGGYAGTLHLIPMGKREPFQPDDASQHTSDELDQMNRRVELREKGP